jgi:hypothetical protein
MAHSNLQLGMDQSTYLPAVMTCIIALPLDEIFKVVISHVAIKDLLDFIFIVAVDNSWGWGRWPGMGSGSARDSLTTRKTGWRCQNWGGRVRCVRGHWRQCRRERISTRVP